MKNDPRLIIEFWAIAEELSFTKAAAKLRVAQPWLSTRLRRLEKNLGFELLQRDTRRVELTDKGALLFEVARELSNLRHRFDVLAAQLRFDQVLRIGAPPYTKAFDLRRKIIDDFCHKFPSVRVELQTGWSLGLQQRLREGQIDVALVVGEFDSSEFEELLISKLGLHITLSRKHPLSSKSLIIGEDLKGQTVHVYTRSLNPELWDRLYAPLLNADVRLIEHPEVAEGGLEHMAADDQVSAFLNLGQAENSSVVTRVPFSAEPSAPLYLLRRRETPTGPVANFWDISEACCGHENVMLPNVGNVSNVNSVVRR